MFDFLKNGGPVMYLLVLTSIIGVTFIIERGLALRWRGIIPRELEDASENLKSAADAETRGWKISAEKTIWYNDALKKNGMTIYPPSPQLKADLKKIGDTMIAEWLKKAGAEGKSILDAYAK